MGVTTAGGIASCRSHHSAYLYAVVFARGARPLEQRQPRDGRVGEPLCTLGPRLAARRQYYRVQGLRGGCGLRALGFVRSRRLLYRLRGRVGVALADDIDCRQCVGYMLTVGRAPSPLALVSLSCSTVASTSTLSAWPPGTPGFRGCFSAIDMYHVSASCPGRTVFRSVFRVSLVSIDRQWVERGVIQVSQDARKKILRPLTRHGHALGFVGFPAIVDLPAPSGKRPWPLARIARPRRRRRGRAARARVGRPTREPCARPCGPIDALAADQENRNHDKARVPWTKDRHSAVVPCGGAQTAYTHVRAPTAQPLATGPTCCGLRRFPNAQWPRSLSGQCPSSQHKKRFPHPTALLLFAASACSR